MKKLLLISLCSILLFAGWVGKLIWDAGQFKTITPHYSGSCRQIDGVTGPEDITIHPETGIAYISAYDRRAVMQGVAAERGIYAYDLNKSDAQPILLTSGPQTDFRPHGISLYRSPEGDDRLFVINHAHEQHSIEIYQILPDKLVHLKTIRDPQLVSPNDLVAVGPEEFYVTNDRKYRSGILSTFESYLRLKLGNVAYYDGSSFSVVKTGFAYANGINISKDGNLLYLATVTEQTLFVFERDRATGGLKEYSKTFLESGLDNIEVDENGDLWIASHPQLLSFLAHAEDATKISPSQVFRVTQATNAAPLFEEVYLNQGKEISGSSVAAVMKNRMLIGAVFDARFLDCQLTN